MGFNETWISLIMSCVTTVTYATIINGIPGRIIKPSRGIRLGDPISPYLFLLCAEGFSALMNQAEKEGKIRGLKIASGCQPINHLFFADDSILFCIAQLSE